MMGVAGEGAKADHVDTLDLFHTMEAYFTWYPNGSRRRVSKYLLNKFLFTVDRDPELVERYREDPAGTVAWWEAEEANRILNCTTRRDERPGWRFTDEERDALADHDHVRAVRAGRAPVPHADAVHRDVRARPRAAGVPDRLRQGDGALHAALPRHRHLSATSDASRRPQRATASRRRTPSTPTRSPARARCWSGSPRRRSCRSTCCARRARRTSARRRCPYVPGVQGVGVDRRPASGSGSRRRPACSRATAARRAVRRGAGRRRTRCPATRRTRTVAALGLSAVAAWLALTCAPSCAPARRCWCSAPAARSARSPSLVAARQGAGRVVGVCRGAEGRGAEPAATAPTRSSRCPTTATPTTLAALLRRGPGRAPPTSSSTRSSAGSPRPRPG